ANAHRLEIVDVLAQGERSVEEVANETDLSVANASQHLQALREAHLVTSRRDGLRIYYRLADPSIFRLVQIIREVAERQLAEVDRIVNTFLTDRKLLAPLPQPFLYPQIPANGSILGHAAMLADTRLAEYNERIPSLRDALHRQLLERIPSAVLNGHPV